MGADILLLKPHEGISIRAKLQQMMRCYTVFAIFNSMRKVFKCKGKA